MILILKKSLVDLSFTSYISLTLLYASLSLHCLIYKMGLLVHQFGMWFE